MNEATFYAWLEDGDLEAAAAIVAWTRKLDEEEAARAKAEKEKQDAYNAKVRADMARIAREREAWER